MIWLAFFRRYAWILAAAALVAIVLYGISRAIDRADQRGYGRATAEMAARIANANAKTAALEQRQREQSDAASAAWETQRNALQFQVDRLLARKPVVRLCHAAREVPVSQPAATAGSFDDPAGGTIDALPSQRDIGPELVQFGGECERYRAQLSALQAWITETR